MKEEFVPVYMASTVAVAQKLADRLAHVGIETFVDDTESPMYGMSLGPRSKVVHVRSPAERHAREIIQDFQQEYDPPAPEDWQGEETGFELPKPQQPSDDSPNEPYSPGTERLSEPSDPGSPELQHMQDEHGRTRSVHRDEIKAVGGERDPLENPEVESDDVAEQRLDDLDIDPKLDVEEARHPAADPPRKGNSRQ